MPNKELNIYNLLIMLYEEEHNYFVLEQKLNNLRKELKALVKIRDILENKNKELIISDDFKRMLTVVQCDIKDFAQIIIVSFLITNSLETYGFKNTKDYETYNKIYNSNCKIIIDRLEKVLLEEQIVEIETLKKCRVNSIYHLITKAISHDKGLKTNTDTAKIYQEKIDVLTNFLTKKGYSEEEIIILFEEIRKQNFEKYHPQEMFYDTIIKLIQTPYEYEEPVYINDKESKTKMDGIMVAFNLACQVNLEYFDSILLNFPTYDDSEYTKDEIDYLYSGFINKYVEEILKYKSQMLLLGNYQDLDERKFIILMYNELNLKYQKIKSRYLSLKEKYKLSHPQVEGIIEKEDERTLLYLMTPNGEESYIERDITRGTFPTQYYDKFQSLLENFKKGTLSQKKYSLFSSIHEKFAGFGKLKDDQVRIVYATLGNNTYLILGAGIKKDTRDNGLYEMLIDRYRHGGFDEKKQLNENSAIVEEKLYGYINEFGTRGTR